MTARTQHIVTLRHRETGEFQSTEVEMTDADREHLIDTMQRGERYNPQAPRGKLVGDLLSGFAINAEMVNVVRFTP